MRIKDMWKLKFIKVVPVTISVKGKTNITLIQSMKIVDLPDGLVIAMQKAAILETCHIVRKFLTVTDGRCISLLQSHKQLKCYGNYMKIG